MAILLATTAMASTMSRSQIKASSEPCPNRRQQLLSCPAYLDWGFSRDGNGRSRPCAEHFPETFPRERLTDPIKKGCGHAPTRARFLAGRPDVLRAGSRRFCRLLAEVSFNGGAFLPICTALPGGTCVGSVGVGGLVVSMAAAQSNSPGNSTLVAVLLSSAVSLMNTNTSGTATAHLLIGDTSWAVPTGAVTMLSHIGGSVAVGGPLNTMAFFSSFDPGTGQNVSPGTFNTPQCLPTSQPPVPTTRRAQ